MNIKMRKGVLEGVSDIASPINSMGSLSIRHGLLCRINMLLAKSMLYTILGPSEDILHITYRVFTSIVNGS